MYKFTNSATVQKRLNFAAKFGGITEIRYFFLQYEAQWYEIDFLTGQNRYHNEERESWVKLERLCREDGTLRVIQTSILNLTMILYKQIP